MIGIVLVAILFILAMALLGADILVPLWNSTIPELFGLKSITFWQSVKLCLIGQILFKGSSVSSSSK